MITPITNHVQRTLALFLDQFKDATNFKNMVTAFTIGLQECEDQTNLIGTSFDLASAVGDQLDIIGDWFGLLRNSATDANFRLAIQLRIFELSASGNNDELQTIILGITAGTRSVYWPIYPAAVQLSTDGLSIPADIWKTMIQFVGAGINLWLFLTYGVLPFACAEDPDPDLLGIDTEDTLGLSDGSDFGIGTTEIGSGSWVGGGGVCDVNPEGVIISAMDSGQVFDVAYEGG